MLIPTGIVYKQSVLDYLVDGTLLTIMADLNISRQSPLKCDSCGKTFSSAKYLKIHINSVHNGQKDHKCDSCGKTFCYSGHLKTHFSLVHNKQKDHKCDLCGKEFSQAGHLKKHINAIHEGCKRT